MGYDPTEADIDEVLARRRGNAARLQVVAGPRVTPEVAATQVRRAGRLGVPVETVRALPEDTERAEAEADIDAVLARHGMTAPATVNRLGNPDLAPVIRPEVDALAANEQAIRALGEGQGGLAGLAREDLPRGMLASRQAGALSSAANYATALAGLDELEGLMSRGTPEPEVQARLAKMRESGSLVFQNVAGAYVNALRTGDIEERDRIRSRLEAAQAKRLVTGINARRALQAVPLNAARQEFQAAEGPWESFKVGARHPIDVAASLTAESLPAMVPALALGAATGGLGGGLTMAAGAAGAGSFVADAEASFVDALERLGVNLDDEAAVAKALKNRELVAEARALAAKHAVPVALLDAAAVGVGGLGLTEKILGTEARGAARVSAREVLRQAGGKAAARQLAGNLGRLGAETVVQTPIQGFLGGAGEALGQVASGQELNWADIMAEVLGEAGGAIGEVATGTYAANRDALRTLSQAKEAVRFREALGNLKDTTEAVQLRESLPEHHRDFVDEVAAEGTDTLYVSPRKFDTLFQEAGADPAEVAKEMGLEQQYAEASRTGADMPIPLSVWTDKVIGSDLHDALADEVRANPEAPTFGEIRAFAEEMSRGIGTEAEAEAGKTTEGPSPVERVQADIEEKLGSVGRFPQDVVREKAGLVARIAAGVGRMAGLDAWTVYQKMPISQIVASRPNLFDTGVTVDELDAMIETHRAEMKRGEVAPGKSLLDFVREQGGLKDSAEVRALDLDAGRKAFRRKVVQKTGLDLDAIGLAAQQAGYFAERPTPDQLLGALREEAAGRPVYTPEVQERAAAADARKETLRKVQDVLRSAGLDLMTSPREQIKQALTFARAAETTPAVERESAEAQTLFQVDSWTPEAKQEIVETNRRLGLVSDERLAKWLEDVNAVGRFLIESRPDMIYSGDPSYNALKPNSDKFYKESLDFSTLCKKRAEYQATIEAIQQRLWIEQKRTLTPDELLDIRQDLLDDHRTVSCGPCYVDSARMKAWVDLAGFAKKYPDLSPHFFTMTGWDYLRTDHPEVYTELRARFGALGGKGFESRTDYRSDILKKFGTKRGQAAVADYNRRSGLRWQSWSDFEMPHAMDAMQAAVDSAAVGLAGHAYTKVGDFVRVMGRTGLMINESLLPPLTGNGLDENGELLFDDVEGMPAAEAFELRDRFPQTTGTILIGVSDEQIRKGLDDPRIDYIIPYHRSGLAKKLRLKMGMTWKDYQDVQNDKVRDKKKNEAAQAKYRKEGLSKAQAKAKASKVQWDEHRGDLKKFKALLKERGLSPRFEAFIDHPNYWKLLVDRRMFDDKGNPIQQRPLKADFDVEEILRLHKTYEAPSTAPWAPTVDRFFGGTGQSDTLFQPGDNEPAGPKNENFWKWAGGTSVPVIEEAGPDSSPVTEGLLRLREELAAFEEEADLLYMNLSMIPTDDESRAEGRSLIEADIRRAEEGAAHYREQITRLEERIVDARAYRDAKEILKKAQDFIVSTQKQQQRVFDSAVKMVRDQYGDEAAEHPEALTKQQKEVLVNPDYVTETTMMLDIILKEGLDGGRREVESEVRWRVARVQEQIDQSQVKIDELVARYGEEGLNESEEELSPFRTGEAFVARVFHGTSSGRLEFFNDQTLGSNTGAPSARMGHFFSGTDDTARSYTGDEEFVPPLPGDLLLPIKGLQDLRYDRKMAEEKLLKWAKEQLAAKQKQVDLTKWSVTGDAVTGFTVHTDKGPVFIEPKWNPVYIGKHGKIKGYAVSTPAQALLTVFREQDGWGKQALLPTLELPKVVSWDAKKPNRGKTQFGTDVFLLGPDKSGWGDWELHDGTGMAHHIYASGLQQARFLTDNAFSQKDEINRRYDNPAAPIEDDEAIAYLKKTAKKDPDSIARMMEQYLGKPPGSFSMAAADENPESPSFVGEYYVRMKNPYVHDYEGERYREESYASVISKAKRAGHDGVVLLNTYDGGPVDNIFVVFDGRAIKEVRNRGEWSPDDVRVLFHAEEGKPAPRGSISFTALGAVIRLGQTADLSTFIHESWHWGFRVLQELAEAADATPEIRAEWERMLAWVGAKPGEPLTREQQEKLADAGEKYLLEGIAPSPDLAGPFRRMKAWLVSIAQEVARLANIHLTPEVRGFFDRLLATDEEIEAAKARLGIGLSEGVAKLLTEGERAKYSEAVARVQATGEERLLRRAMSDIRRERRKWWREERARVAAEVTAEVDARPEQRALAWLSKGTLPDGSPGPEGLPLFKLSREALVQGWGEGALALLPKGVAGPEKGGGVPGYHPDLVADLFGFASGDQLVRALWNVTSRRKAIEADTAARMQERHGSMMEAGAIEKEAAGALHNDDLERLVVREMSAIRRELAHRTDKRQLRQDIQDLRAKHQGDRAALKAEVRKRGEEFRALRRNLATRIPAKMVEALKASAADLIASKTVRDAVQSNRYLAASTRAARDAERALQKGDYREALDHKQRQLFNHFLFREALRAEREVETKRRALRKLEDANRGPKSIALDYRERVEALLAAVGLGRDTLRNIQANASQRKLATSLAAWVAQLEADGEDVPEIDSALLTFEPVHYTEMTLEAFRGLYDSVRSISHAGRQEQSLIARGERESLENTVKALKARADAQPQRKKSARVTAKPGVVAKGIANSRRLEGFLRTAMDGAAGTKLGPWFDAFMGRVAWSQERKTQLLVPIVEEIEQAALALLGKRGTQELTTKEWQTAKRIDRLGVEMTKAEVLALALNMGNADNIDRLLKGFGKGAGAWTLEMLRDTVNETLSADEARFVGRVWQAIDRLWPEVEALQVRAAGVRPQKVQAVPIRLSGVDLPGGYYPIAYNRNSGENIAGNAAAGRKTQQNEASKMVQESVVGQFMRAMTRKGHTEARVGGGGQQVLLDLSVLWRHLDDVTHDLAYRLTVRDMNRLLAQPEVIESIVNVGGTPMLDQMTGWVRDIATDYRVAHDMAWYEALLMKSRTASVAMSMGFNVAIAMDAFSDLALFTAPGGLGITNTWAGLRAALAGRDGESRAATVAAALEKSAVLRHYAEEWSRDVLDVQKRSLSGKPVSRWQGALFALAGQVNYQVAVAGWLGAYQAALADNTEADAIAYADSEVRRILGTGRAQDLAKIMRPDNPTSRLWTMYYGWFSKNLNLFLDTYELARRGQISKPALLGSFTALYVLPAILPEVLRGRYRRPDNDDEEEEPWALFALKKAGTDLLLFAPAHIPMLGSAIRAVTNTRQGRVDWEPTAAFRPIANSLQALYDVGQATKAWWNDEDDPLKEIDPKTMLDLAGWGNVPTGQVWKMLDAFRAWLAAGEGMSVGDTVNAAVNLALGRPPKSKRL